MFKQVSSLVFASLVVAVVFVVVTPMCLEAVEAVRGLADVAASRGVEVTW